MDTECEMCRWWASKKSRRYKETFIYLASEWDVDRAHRLIAAAPCVLTTLNAECLREVLKLIGLNEKHVDHVDPTRPGILATTPLGLLMIDGHHRASKALKQGIDFQCFTLDEKESRKACFRGSRFIWCPASRR